MNQTNTAAIAFGSAALVALILGRTFFRKIPAALLVIVGGIAAAELVDASAYGVKLIGPVPKGLPQLGLSAVHWSDVNEVLPLAMAGFMLAAVETVAIGRTFALKHGYPFDPNREFLGLAVANLGAGAGRGFPVSGGMTQSLVNESAGASTPLSGQVSSLIILLIVLSGPWRWSYKCDWYRSGYTCQRQSQQWLQVVAMMDLWHAYCLEQSTNTLER